MREAGSEAGRCQGAWSPEGTAREERLPGAAGKTPVPTAEPAAAVQGQASPGPTWPLRLGCLLVPLMSLPLDRGVLTPPPSPGSARPQAAVLSPPCRGRCAESRRRRGCSSPALSNLWELAPLITMTTGVGASVSVAVTVRGRRSPVRLPKGGRMLPLPPATQSQGAKPDCPPHSARVHWACVGGGMSPTHPRWEEPGCGLGHSSLGCFGKGTREPGRLGLTPGRESLLWP